MEEEDDDDSDADSAITPNSDRNASRAARKKSKPIALTKNGKLDKGKATAGMTESTMPRFKLHRTDQ